MGNREKWRPLARIVGGNIATQLKKKGIRPAELARLWGGKDRSYITKITKGNSNLTLEQIQEIMDILDIEDHILLFR